MLSPVGSQLKISENLKPNQLVSLAMKLEFFLRDFASLGSLVLSNSTQGIKGFYPCSARGISYAKTLHWAVSRSSKALLLSRTT